MHVCVICAMCFAAAFIIYLIILTFFIYLFVAHTHTHTGQMQSNLSQAAELNQSMLRDLWGVISC